jgi:cellulose synthase/poly-beta-1,6-N-acetylglucosamine synthase-like glycosyltransferase
MSVNVIVVSREVQRNFGVINNYLDVPLILTAMLMFCSEKWKQRVILTTIICFAVYEMLILLQYKLDPTSSKYIMGPGILLVLFYSLYLFIINIKNTIVQGKGLGKTLMITSILFAYGCYFLVYLFAYIQKTTNKGDVFIIYYLASIIFSVLMSAGLIWVKKRLREIKEVQTTRKELNVFFNNHYS